MRAHEIKDVIQFAEVKGQAACDYCGSFELMTREKAMHVELFCDSCHRHIKYLSHGKQLKTKRPNGGLKAPEVWAEFSDHCSFCGLSGAEVEFLGIQREIQHVPPYSENGHEFALPICTWCQQTSAANMKRLQSLIKRLSEKFDIK